jgi:hypothetical protein
MSFSFAMENQCLLIELMITRRENVSKQKFKVELNGSIK